MPAKYDVLVCGVWHETNGFSPIATDISDFREYQYFRGDDLTRYFGGTNTEIGGMLNGAVEHDLTIIPSRFAGALPSGPVATQALEEILSDIESDIRSAAALDGILLVLHGAMVSESYLEADRFFAQRIRDVCGPELPIVATFDSHANLSPGLIDAVDVLIGYDTLPHTDMADRGCEAARIMANLLSTSSRPYHSFEKLPLLSTPQMQATDDRPMFEVMRACRDLEAKGDLLTCSVALGFPYADVPHLGMSVLAYSFDRDTCAAATSELATLIWKSRHDFIPSLLSPDEAIQKIGADDRGPVVLLEPSDNVGGGAPGDGTHLLSCLVANRVSRCAITIWDPEAVGAAGLYSEGDDYFEGEIGGKSHPLSGSPVLVRAQVKFFDQLSYNRDQAYMKGQPIDLGLCALLDSNGLLILLTTNRLMPFDTMHLRLAGIVPEELKAICLKCGSNWKSVFGTMASDHYYVDTPGICPAVITRGDFTRLTRPYFPLDLEANWEAAAHHD